MADIQAKVRDHVLGLNKTERQKFLAALLAKARTEIDVATVYVNGQDESLLKDASRGISKDASKDASKESLKVVPKDIDGGLIAETADGKISVNYSVEELISNLMEKKAGDVNEVLFGNE